LKKLRELNRAQLADTHAADLAKGHPGAKTALFPVPPKPRRRMLNVRPAELYAKA